MTIYLTNDRQFVIGTFGEPRPVRIVSLKGEKRDFKVKFPNKTYPQGSNASTYIKSIDKLMITDRYEHTVYLYDIKIDSRVVVKDDQIEEPCGAAVSPSETILVCCRNTNCIVHIRYYNRTS
jgi:hypothetical protein